MYSLNENEFLFTEANIIYEVENKRLNLIKENNLNELDGSIKIFQYYLNDLINGKYKINNNFIIEDLLLIENIFLNSIEFIKQGNIYIGKKLLKDIRYKFINIKFKKNDIIRISPIEILNQFKKLQYVITQLLNFF